MDIKNNGRIFYIGEEDKPDGYISYNIVDRIMNINSTVVDPSMRGKGVAGILTKYVLDYAREENIKVKPFCSYTVAYFDKHHEYCDILA